MSSVIQTFLQNDVWVAPNTYRYITIECWGAGGGGIPGSGAFLNPNYNGSGGGGGAYAKTFEQHLIVTPGKTYTIIVGSGGSVGTNGGDSSFKAGDTPYCLAKGGSGAYFGRAGGLWAESIGSATARAGGNGAVGGLTGPGGAGASAGPSGDGLNADTVTGGAFLYENGSGGNGLDATVGANGGFPGGGGAGGGNLLAGGVGGNGRVRITYTVLDCHRGVSPKHEGLSSISFMNPVSFDDY